MTATTIARTLAALSATTILAGGCIFTVSDPGDDAGASAADDDSGFNPSDDGGGPVDDTGVDDGADDGAGTGGADDGAAFPGECSENLFLDPSFEAGTPNENWDEASVAFGSPLCDGSCTTDPGATPYDGDWWVWFGGLETEESASMAQSLTFEGDAAFLTFQFAINAAAGTGSDLFTVSIDDQEIFMASDAEATDYETYTAIEIDLTDWADGEPHTITFGAALAGGGLTNFFLDDVSMTQCTLDETTGSTGADETGDAGTGGDTGSSGGDSAGSGDSTGDAG